MKKLIVCLLTALCLLPAGLRAAANEDIALAKRLCDQYQDAVVWISAVAKISISSTSPLARNIPDREQKFEALGTFVDGSGLLVTALSNIDPSAQVSGRTINTPQGSVTLDASTILKEVKIILPDGSEIPADVVMKDADLDLAFLRPKPDAREAKDVKFTYVDLKESGTAGLADQVVSLARADEILNRQPQVGRGQVVTVTKRPRQFLRVNNATPGAPTFDMEGKLLGLGINRSTRERGPITVVLPTADVLDIAEQARDAKPIIQEEPSKAEEEEKDEDK